VTDDKPRQFALAVFLVAVAVALSLAVLAGGPGYDQARLHDFLQEVEGPRSQHAHRLCETYAQSHGWDSQIVAWGATTARQVQFSGEQLDVSVAPWDKVSDDHFIARCSTFVQVTPSTPTRKCPNGKTVPDLRDFSVLVDDDGRATPDPSEGSAKVLELQCSGRV